MENIFQGFLHVKKVADLQLQDFISQNYFCNCELGKNIRNKQASNFYMDKLTAMKDHKSVNSI